MMSLPIQGRKAHLTDNSIHVQGVTAGGADGFSVWSTHGKFVLNTQGAGT